jgi:serine/threonine protein phosphatase 1
MSKKYFAISDVHSFYDEMLEALKSKGFDIQNPDHNVIICGDAFDRGEFSFKVFEFMKILNNENRLIYVRGNHEDLLFDCIDELVRYGKCGGHHYSNGTVKTLSHFINEDDYWIYSTYIPTNIIESIVNNTKELRAFIQDTCVDYFTLGNKIFVHSWLPTYNDLDKGEIVHEEWFNSSRLPALWKKARWGNPFQMWEDDLTLKDKCIVFGHWHTSWFWSHIKQERKEWPPKNRSDWYKSFEPVILDNIIGLDSCVAYSGFINCIVFDENGEIID